MKVCVVNWAGGVTEEVEQLGLTKAVAERQELEMNEEELQDLTFRAFNTGLNVMLKRHSNGFVMLCLDHRGFTQR